jgi:predicted RNA binding protein YcfA (HicA-like mRNA interferase family)
MKRTELIRHLVSHGCELKREGAEHSIYWRPATGARTTVPRHREINDITARKICRDLGIPEL